MKIEVIFFDVNGTLRSRQPDPQTQQTAIDLISKRLRIPLNDSSRWQELEIRYEAYSKWSKENLAHLPEEEIWTKWMCFDKPIESIAPYAAQLMKAWIERKGKASPIPQVEETLITLKSRGYRLGLISNTVSTLDIPDFLLENHWNGFFEGVFLSSEFKSKKPEPDIFIEAVTKMGTISSRCAFVGNRYSKDIVGCKLAGFAQGILLDNPKDERPTTFAEATRPDRIIHGFEEILAVFP
ncbi:MAG: HAD family hydrolase [Anaerolineaceae bacterium]